jgi:hypothetical protein
MTLIPDKTGEVKAVLTNEHPATSFPLTISEPNKYSVWTSSKNGTVRVYSEFDLHIPVAIGQQQLAHHLEPGNYFVSLIGDIGTFTLNVTAVKPVATPEPVRSPVVLEAEAQTDAQA